MLRANSVDRDPSHGRPKVGSRRVTPTITKEGSQNRFMWIPILISVEIRSYDSLSINKSKNAILAINRYIKGLLVVDAKGAKNSNISLKSVGIKKNLSKLGLQSNKAEQPQSFEHNKCKADKRESTFSPIDLSYSETGQPKKVKQVNPSNSDTNELVTLSTREKHFSFPTKRKMFTVLRSPHIDKKSREHFQWKQSKTTVFLEFKKPGEWDLFLFILENARLPGVQLLVGCQYSTFCAF